MGKNYFLSGAWNVTCDVCSKKIKASEAKQRWDGLIVCPSDFEHRHPQDFVKAKTDKITVPYVRPIPTDTFILQAPVFDTQSVTDASQFQTITDFNRSLFDASIPSDILVFSATAGLSENQTVNDSITLTKVGGSIFTDTVSASASGYLFYNNYIDITYFSEDYVGTVVNF